MFLTVSASDHSIGSGFSFPAHQGGKGGFCPARELPPRARRIRDRRRTRRIWVGTTSACAENTRSHQVFGVGNVNYLRVRGEYPFGGVPIILSTELPPRARRIPFFERLCGYGAGTTSACAENTPLRRNLLTFSRSYLRVRGEYRNLAAKACLCMELPPRARRIHRETGTTRCRRGTTSACAENTLTLAIFMVARRNYLRVRGEYRAAASASFAFLELPPRARRILVCGVAEDPCQGTTSACAENTRTHTHRWRTTRNYLRVRGEYPPANGSCGPKLELPPRARRILGDLCAQFIGLGTTSACAENTE